MRRRICLMGAALSVLPLAFVAGNATAASKKSGGGPTKTVTCSVKTTTAIPADQTNLAPPLQQGTEYGTVGCAKLVGSGVIDDAFSTPASGDTVAKYTMYFGAGTLHGTYDLTPQGEPANFLETDWTGTAKVLGGTGAYKGVTGTGKMVCKTLDGVHTTCTDRFKLKGA